MMRGAGRRRPKDSYIPPPPQHHYHRRDSDASFASSRPSSIGIGRSSAADVIQDRSYQQSAIRAVNAYLSLHSFPLTLKPPLPSAKEITESLKFILTQLDFPPSKLEEDLPVVLKSLNCPFKVTRSAIRTPATPTAWPTLCAVIHWLTQVAVYNEKLSSDSGMFLENNSMFDYALSSYLHYIRGEDDAVDELDREFLGKLEQERDNAAESVKGLEGSVKELEKKVEGMKGSSEREEKEKEKAILEEDVNKFHTIISELNGRIADIEKMLEQKEKDLALKMEENKRICDENGELKRQVELQTFNARDVERMRRELQAVERNTEEAEAARISWEEKCWDLDSEIGQKLKELERLSMECNKALRRLKLAESLHYVLDAKGSTPAEVMGIDYKTKLKPALDSLNNEIKKSSMEKYDELILLQQQSQENALKLDGKRNRITELQAYIDEVEAQIHLLRKEIDDYIQRCAAESKKMMDDVQREDHNLDVVEREAEEVLRTTKLKLHEASQQSEEEIQRLAYELFTLVDSISKHKEYVESKIAEMKNDLSEASSAVATAYKDCLQAQLGVEINTNH